MADDFVLDFTFIDDDVFFDYTLINQNLLNQSLFDEDIELPSDDEQVITIPELYY